MFFAASSDNQFWKFSFGSGLTRLRMRSAADMLWLSVDNSPRTYGFLDSLSRASVETANGKTEEGKIKQ